MIQAVFDKSGDEARMTVRGHAGYAPAGQDIVCAAVSTVVAVCELTLDATGCRWEEVTEHGGPAGVTVCGVGGEAACIVNVARQALLEIARQYPDNVRVEDGGWR